MADTKISELENIPDLDVSGGDSIPIVDDNGTPNDTSDDVTYRAVLTQVLNYIAENVIIPEIEPQDYAVFVSDVETSLQNGSTVPVPFEVALLSSEDIALDPTVENDTSILCKKAGLYRAEFTARLVLTGNGGVLPNTATAVMTYMGGNVECSTAEETLNDDGEVRMIHSVGLFRSTTENSFFGVKMVQGDGSMIKLSPRVASENGVYAKAYAAKMIITRLGD